MRPQPDPTGFNAPSWREAHRLFFALWPDATLRQRIAEATTRLAAARATHGRRLRPQRYHLTLQFLGDFNPLPPSLIDDAIAAADDVRSVVFEMALDRAGSFGGTRVGWLGPTSTPPGLLALREALGLALDRYSVPHPSSAVATFTPHVTILRGMRQPLPAIAIPSLAWPVGGFVLIHSRPGQGDYTVLRHWKLRD